MPNFLDLPAELRLKIYELLLPTNPSIKLWLIEPKSVPAALLTNHNLSKLPAVPAQRLIHLPSVGKSYTAMEKLQTLRIISFYNACRNMRSECQQLLYTAIVVRAVRPLTRHLLGPYCVGFCMQLQHLSLTYELLPARSDEVLQRHPQLQSLRLRWDVDIRNGEQMGEDNDENSSGAYCDVDAHSTQLIIMHKGMKRRVMNVVSSPHSRMVKAALVYERRNSRGCVLIFFARPPDRRPRSGKRFVWAMIDLDVFREGAKKRQGQCPVTPIEALEAWDGEQDLAMFDEPTEQVRIDSD